MRSHGLSKAIAFAAAGSLLSTFGAFDGTPVSSATVVFRAYVADSAVYALTNAEDVAAWPVTWFAGETVDATAMDGTKYVLSDADGGAATSATLPEKGGVWMLVNSEVGEARISVPWSAYQGIGVSLATGAMDGGFAADTVQSGPNRKGDDRRFPPIAYSGDDWAGDESAASALTIVPPAGGEPIFLDGLVGEGTVPFFFDRAGLWTVSLTMADGRMRTAVIGRSGGFVLFIR